MTNTKSKTMGKTKKVSKKTVTRKPELEKVERSGFTGKAITSGITFSPIDKTDRSKLGSGAGIKVWSAGSSGSATVVAKADMSLPVAMVNGIDISFPYDPTSMMEANFNRQFAALKRASMGVSVYGLSNFKKYSLCAIALRAKVYEAINLVRLFGAYMSQDSGSPNDILYAVGLKPNYPDNIYEYVDRLNIIQKKLSYLCPTTLTPMDIQSKYLFGNMFTDRADGTGIPIVNLMHHVNMTFNLNTPERDFINVLNSRPTSNGQGCWLFQGYPTLLAADLELFGDYLTGIENAVSLFTKLTNFQEITSDIIRVYGEESIYRVMPIDTTFAGVYDASMLSAIQNADIFFDHAGSFDPSDTDYSAADDSGAITVYSYNFDTPASVDNMMYGVMTEEYLNDTVSLDYGRSVGDILSSVKFKVTVGSHSVPENEVPIIIGPFRIVASNVLVKYDSYGQYSPIFASYEGYIRVPLGVFLTDTAHMDDLSVRQYVGLSTGIINAIPYAPRCAFINSTGGSEVGIIVEMYDMWEVDSWAKIGREDIISLRSHELDMLFNQNNLYKPVTVSDI